MTQYNNLFDLWRWVIGRGMSDVRFLRSHMGLGVDDEYNGWLFLAIRHHLGDHDGLPCVVSEQSLAVLRRMNDIVLGQRKHGHIVHDIGSNLPFVTAPTGLYSTH